MVSAGVGSPIKTQTTVDDSGMGKDVGNVCTSSVVTFKPFICNDEVTESSILHVKPVPLN